MLFGQFPGHCAAEDEGREKGNINRRGASMMFVSGIASSL